MPLWRRVAGIGVLAVLVIVTAMLVPPYLRNMQFQRYLDDLVDRSHTPEILKAEAINRAAQMGLPVRSGDVRVEQRGSGIRVDIIYVVRVDLPLYTVDLHFHPTAKR